MYLLTEVASDVLIKAEDFSGLIDPLKNIFSAGNIVTVVGVGIGAVGSVVLTVWGIKKIVSMISTAFKTGRIKA